MNTRVVFEDVMGGDGVLGKDNGQGTGSGGESGGGKQIHRFMNDGSCFA